MPIENYKVYYPQSITRLVHILAANGIHSRQDLLEKYDVDATQKQYALLKGIGPILGDLLEWLREQPVEEWVRLTGLPAANESEPQKTINERQQKAFSSLSDGLRDAASAAASEADGMNRLNEVLTKLNEEPEPPSAEQDWS